ncbi:MAG: hypothetical protein L6Q78_05655 [Bacteroidia bacterium]|nr:hypothetical protein [Bacteroidia bacterium]
MEINCRYFYEFEIEYAGCTLEQATAGSSVQVYVSPAKADGDYKRMARPAGVETHFNVA